MLFDVRQGYQQIIGCLFQKFRDYRSLKHAIRNTVQKEGIQRESHTVNGRLNLGEIILELIDTLLLKFAYCFRLNNLLKSRAPCRSRTTTRSFCSTGKG